MTKLDVFACSNAEAYPLFGWGLVAAALSFCIYFIWFKRPDPTHADSDSDDAPRFDAVVPLAYVEQCVRLSEKRMAELITIIQSFEKKALAVIAGAVALIGFISTKPWCGDVTSYAAAISILAGIGAVINAGFIIKASKVGIAGSTPKYMVNYYYNHLRELKYDGDASTPQIREAEISYLLLTVLSEYERVIQLTAQVSDSKAVKFDRAANFLLVAFAGALVWLLMKIGGGYF